MTPNLGLTLCRDVSDLSKFTNLRTLILDHNSIAVVNELKFPPLQQLETLSLSYNSIRDMDQMLMALCTNVSQHEAR